ncbi:superoxide dismutase [Trypanosoma conorhini]|uniref:Superoxide dismutase n=1 Tax=Trypanosoma conorhini TaxID=83891 RepID=A0A3R7N447_9TRYP|nr:superoxide dismutase [Trypanosoma conorhini]RNF25131.1 superoxide dismutase [Trypanosoma conorhini]
MRRTVRLGYHAYVPKGALLKSEGLAASPHLATAVFRETEAAAARADKAKEDAGFFSQPRLNYPIASGIPAFISKRQFDVQYNIFHRDAVQTLNQHTLGTPLEGHNLETVIRRTSFDATQAVAHTAAAEHFNYCFFYKSLRPWGTAVPKQLCEAFQLQYGRNGSVDVVEEVKRVLTVTVLSHQERCGWVYLVWTGKQFDVVEFPHGACPIASDLIPLLAINVHESAYCFDYGPSGLEQYTENYFKACNWTLAERYYLQAARQLSYGT